MKNLKLRSYFLYTLLFAVFIIFTSCSEWDDDGVDFRNFIRDSHPYCEIEEIKTNALFSYKVNDTIKNEIWIYTSNRNEDSMHRFCINCK